MGAPQILTIKVRLAAATLGWRSGHRLRLLADWLFARPLRHSKGAPGREEPIGIKESAAARQMASKSALSLHKLASEVWVYFLSVRRVFRVY